MQMTSPAFLVENGRHGNSSFTGLPIAKYEFSLAAADRYDCINNRDSCLKRNRYWRPVHNEGSLPFNRQPLGGIEFSVSVERRAERINHTTDQHVTDGDIHHPPGPFSPVSSMQLGIVAEQNRPHLVGIDIEGNSVYAALNLHQFFIANTRQAAYFGYAVKDCSHYSVLNRAYVGESGAPCLFY